MHGPAFGLNFRIGVPAIGCESVAQSACEAPLQLHRPVGSVSISMACCCEMQERGNRPGTGCNSC